MDFLYAIIFFSNLQTIFRETWSIINVKILLLPILMLVINVYI